VTPGAAMPTGVIRRAGAAAGWRSIGLVLTVRPHPAALHLARAGEGHPLTIRFCAAGTCPPIAGDHADDCEDPTNCWGCLRRRAEGSLAVCTACRLRFADRLLNLGIGQVHSAHEGAGQTLPSLYDALLQPTRIASATPSGRSDEPPLALADGPLAARREIERLLASWCGTLHRDIFTERTDGTPVLVRLGHRMFGSSVPIRTEHVLWYSRELLADPYLADQLVTEVDAAYVEAFRQAFPAVPPGQVIGTCPLVYSDESICGGKVRAVVETADAEGKARCQLCRTSKPIREWLALMQAQVQQPEWLTMPDLRWHLTILAERTVSPFTIRSWARDQAVLPTRRPGVVPYAGERRGEGRGSAGQVEYLVTAAVALARAGRGRGRPPAPRRPLDDTVPA
jgi:hypothetical protein